MATQLGRRAGDAGLGNFRNREDPATRPIERRRRRNRPERRGREDLGQERLARGLGWFSIGLGMAQIGAPRSVARLIGVSDADETRNIMLAIGLRELASGIGILTRSNPAPFLWTRVGGDIMDLALLGRELTSDRSQHTRLAATTAAVMGVTLLDLYTSQELSRTGNGAAVAAGRERGIQLTVAITVNRPVEEAYRFWRDFQNLPRFMSHLGSVRPTGTARLHWTARGPAGLEFQWDSEIVDDRPNELIAWRSVPGGDVHSAGSVEFRPAPGGRGTEVIMELQYRLPGGRIVARLAKVFNQALEVQIERDLRAFKQIMEVGEVVHSEASLHRGPHPARPSTEPSRTEP